MKMENPINIEQLQRIINLSKKSVVKIKKQNMASNTGFLCNVHFPDKKTLPILITSNHILNENDITVGKKVNFSLDNDNIFYQILIDETRKVYSNRLYDITFIEIKKSDGLNISSFLEVDPNIFSFHDIELINKQVCLLSYHFGKELQFSNGKIKNLGEDGYHIYHFCSSNLGCAGGPIIGLNNNHVIAVHQGAMEQKFFNIGIFLKMPLEEFDQINN